jgi:hypothetical protein
LGNFRRGGEDLGEFVEGIRHGDDRVCAGVAFLAALNMYFGVARAGYAFREELPIFLAIFLVPAIIAVVGMRWLR